MDVGLVSWRTVVHKSSKVTNRGGIKKEREGDDEGDADKVPLMLDLLLPLEVGREE